MRPPEAVRSLSSRIARKATEARAAGRILTIALLCGAAVPAGAAIPRTAPVAEAVSQAELRGAIGRAVERGRAGDCSGVLAVLDPLIPRLSAGAERNGVQRMRLACLGPAGRGAEMGGVQRELAAAMPQDGFVQSYGILIAAGEGKFAEAAEQLATLAENDPGSLAMVSGNSWRGIALKLTEESRFALRDRVFLALARADWQPQDRPDMRDVLAQGAIEALLEKREINEAAGLLDRVEMPEMLYVMATERHYEPLWPQIEARLGPQAGKAIDRFAAQRLADYGRNPGDPHLTREAIRAFVLLGRYPEAAEIAAQVPIIDGMGEDEVVSVRYHAQALAALGRRGEAANRLRAFTGLDLAKTPEAASGLVGLAETLDEDGQAEQALAAARAALARGGEVLSPWGKVWLKRTEACALGALGRTAEARAAGDGLKRDAAQNQAAAIEGLLCLGRDDEAAAIALSAFATTEGAGAIIDQFQPDGAIWAPAQSRLRALWAPFLERADVKKAFDRRARILPRSLWPAQEPRPIPRTPSANSGPVA